MDRLLSRETRLHNRLRNTGSEATDVAPVQHELRLRAASAEEADCWYECLESARFSMLLRASPRKQAQQNLGRDFSNPENSGK